MDEWTTTYDVDANYVTGDGFSDKFAFSIDVNCKEEQMLSLYIWNRNWGDPLQKVPCRYHIMTYRSALLSQHK